MNDTAGSFMAMGFPYLMLGWMLFHSWDNRRTRWRLFALAIALTCLWVFSLVFADLNGEKQILHLLSW